jgi:hypothetical protein
MGGEGGSFGAGHTMNLIAAYADWAGAGGLLYLYFSFSRSR